MKLETLSDIRDAIRELFRRLESNHQGVKKHTKTFPNKVPVDVAAALELALSMPKVKELMERKELTLSAWWAFAHEVDPTVIEDPRCPSKDMCDSMRHLFLELSGFKTRWSGKS